MGNRTNKSMNSCCKVAWERYQELHKEEVEAKLNSYELTCGVCQAKTFFRSPSELSATKIIKINL